MLPATVTRRGASGQALRAVVVRFEGIKMAVVLGAIWRSGSFEGGMRALVRVIGRMVRREMKG